MSIKLKMPEPTGSCKICGINLYGADKKPVIFPCGIKDCPYETEEEYLALKAKTDKLFAAMSNYHEAET